MDAIVFVIAVVAALFAFEGLAVLFSRRSNPTRVRDRLQRLAPKVAANEVDQGRSMLRSRAPVFGGLELLLYRAGAPMRSFTFIVASIACGVLPFVGAFAYTASPVQSAPALALAAVPWIWIRNKARKRMRRFHEQLPDAIELLTRSLRAGHSLGTGFQLVGDELADPIGTELGLLAEEIRLGLGVREALDNLMVRVDNPDLPYLATAVVIQRQTGGNLAELLDKLGDMLRQRMQFAGRVQAMTAQGRGAATFLALWLPIIVAVVMVVAPEYLEPLFETTWGLGVLASAFAVDIVAYVMALRISDVEA